MGPVLCEWGPAGVEALRAEVAVLVIVDVLSFSTAVDVAVSRGAVVYPFPYGDMDAAEAEAARLGALLARPRKAAGGQLSLSPASLQAMSNGTRLLLPSPNGARLSHSCGGDIPVLAGCLRNAGAVAAAARRIAGDRAIGVVPAGERWKDGSLRPAIEDLLGAGAIVHRLAGDCSVEAETARDAWRAAAGDLARRIRTSTSGRELCERGFAEDVAIASQQEASGCAPRLFEGAYRLR